MIRYDMPQGSEAWVQARLGIPTASSFDSILTRSGKPSASATKYRARLLAEWWLGYPLETAQQIEAMERGKRLEPEARALYELQRDEDVDIVGFCVRDDGLVGCSPDGLVGEDGGLELKCPLIHTHMVYLIEPNELIADYYHQLQGCLYVTGRSWWDIVSYNPELPPVIQRVERDDKYITALDSALAAFVPALEEAQQRLEQYRGADVGAARRALLAQAEP